jgi:hypothetical protein
MSRDRNPSGMIKRKILLTHLQAMSVFDIPEVRTIKNNSL